MIYAFIAMGILIHFTLINKQNFYHKQHLAELAVIFDISNIYKEVGDMYKTRVEDYQIRS
jgi:hypothetical protein